MSPATLPVVGAAGRDGVTVAACQLAPRVGERERNLDRLAAAVRQAAAAGARLVVLPELASSGYVFRDRTELLSVAEPADGPTTRLLHALAAEHDLVLVAGLPEVDGAEVFNSAVVVDAGGLCATYRKVHLWDAEKGLFSAGHRPPPVVTTSAGRVATMVCYDLEFPEWTRHAAAAGADIVCAPTNWPRGPRPAGERPIELVGVQAAAAANRIFLAVADRTGHERGVDWVSASAVVGPDGYPLSAADPGGGEQVVLATCRLEEARRKDLNPHNHVFEDRRVDLYAIEADAAEVTARGGGAAAG